MVHLDASILMHLTAVNAFHPIRICSWNYFITQHSLMTLAHMYPFIPSVCLKRALICTETAVRTGLWHCLSSVHFSWLKAWEINEQFPIQHLNQCLRVTCRKERNVEGVFFTMARWRSAGATLLCLLPLVCSLLQTSVCMKKKKNLLNWNFF